MFLCLKKPKTSHHAKCDLYQYFNILVLLIAQPQ